MRSDTVLAKKQLPTGCYDAVRYGVCGNCPAGCGIKAFFNQGTFIDIFGDEEHPLNKGSLCPKGLSLYHAHTHRKRLWAPCVRKKNTDAWTQVSWDEAFDTLAQRLASMGKEATLALPSSSHDPFDYYIGAEWYASVFPRVCGPNRFVPRPLGTKGKLAAMFGIPGAALSMNAQRDWAMSRAVLVVGGDMAAESPVSFGPLEDTRDRGAALLYIGAHNGMTAMRASEAMLVLPGTESAVLAAIVNILLHEGRVDEAFLSEFADGLETLRNEVSAMTPQQAARLCSVSEEQVKRFARILGHTLPVQVQPAASLDDDALALCGALVALRGCIGIPGGGLNLHAVSPFRTGGLFGANDSSGKPLDEMVADKECQAIIGFGNWAGYLPGGNAIRAALNECGLLVHVGCFDDATRALAHISLPAAHWSEYASLVDVNDTRALQWRGALFEPTGQSRTPLDIWTGIAGRMNPDLRPLWNDMPRRTPQRRMASFVLSSTALTRGITVEALDRERCGLSGGIQWPCPDAEDAAFERSRYVCGTVRGNNILFAPCGKKRNGERLATRDKRIRLDAIGLGVAWMCILAAEMIGGEMVGVGRLILKYAELLRMSEILVGMLIIGIIGFIMNAIFILVENHVFRWRSEVSMD